MNDWNNRWTGGQYSLFRALMGTYLLALCTSWIPLAAELGSSAIVAQSLLVAGALSAVCFALGFRDRVASVVLCALCVVLAVNRFQAGLPAAVFGPACAAIVLAVHGQLPRAPYGSLDARGRVDPRGGWRMDRRIFAAVWLLLVVALACRGALGLVGMQQGTEATAWRVVATGVDLLFVPLAFFCAARPWILAVFLAWELASVLVLGLPGAGFGVVLLGLLAFDPAWVWPRHALEPERVFYDGTCGLCHGFVRFVLAEDGGAAFHFGPLQGETFAKLVPERERAGVPDSIVVRTVDGRLLLKSAAVVHVLRALGGAWRVLGEVLVLVPRALRDAGYDLVARVRHRLFARPEGACPLVPPDLGRRFEI